MPDEDVLEVRRETVRRVLDVACGWKWPGNVTLAIAQDYEDKYGSIGIVDEIKQKRAELGCFGEDESD